MSIQLLAPAVAAKIAAGEVVERPANVAKELIENSLDAGATDIRVEMREGGLRLLRIGDNGAGIPAAEAHLAFVRHATSKVQSAADLERIATFGFRGEALYSIAAVSHCTLLTHHAGEEFGTQLRLEGGALLSQSRAGAPVGTIMTIEHIFYNVPARQKFLRAPTTEAGQIAAVVQRYALAYPERRFALISDGKTVFQSSGSGNLVDVLVQLYGLDNARQMIPLRADGNVATPEAPLDEEIDFGASDSRAVAALPEAIQVTGYVGLPSFTRANRTGIQLFVNRRAVEDRSLTHAVVQAFHTLLPVGRFPVAVVLVEIDPVQVDVNVHPQKLQVRFVEERRVFSAVQKVVRAAVIGRLDVPGMDGTQPAPADFADIAPTWNATGWPERRNALVNAGVQHAFELPPRAPEDAAAASHSATAGVAPTYQTDDAPPPPPSLPPLRVVGQVGAMYVVAEGPQGMFLIDQHAAHERILYERFMNRRNYNLVEGEMARQQLLQPLPLHAGSELAGMVADHLDALRSVGFDIEPFGGDSFLVRGVPGLLAGDDPINSLLDIVTSLSAGRNLAGEQYEAELVKMVCKRAAIKAGQLLSDIEMQELVRQLEECASPRTCPHGRPTMIQLSAGELEKAFGRI
jgi:DNA mismatch repair protein MutL